MKAPELSFLDNIKIQIDTLERDAGVAYMAFADASKRAKVLEAFRTTPAKAMALADRMLLGKELRFLPFQSPTVIATAIAVLALAGEKAKPRLVELTEKGPPSAVLHARVALAAIGGETSLPKKAKDLIAALGDKAPKVRVSAAAELVRVASPDSLSALRNALDDAHPSVRAEAARALGTLGDSDVFDRLLARFIARPKAPPASARGAVPAQIADALSAYDALVRLGDARAIGPLCVLASEPRYVSWIDKVAENPPIAALTNMQPVGIVGVAECALSDEGALDAPLFVTHMQDEGCADAAKSILERWRTQGPATKLKRRTAIAASLLDSL